MSDDSTSGWTPPNQPATPGGGIPAPMAPPTPPTPAASSVPPPPPPNWSPVAPSDDPAGDGPTGGRTTSSKKLLIGGVVAVLAVGAAGVFAVTQMSGGNEGGAASPEELGEAFMESLDQEDLLGAIDLLLPGERETFKEPAQEMISELTRLEVLTDDASLDDLSGFEITLDDRDVQVTDTNVDDIANIRMSADATATINGEELPIGDLITENLGDDFDRDELTTEESGLDFEVPMTAVEEDGRWYLSYFYTVAEDARGDRDIPETGIEPQGGDSPEAALDVFFAGMTDLDLTALIASLNPNEAQALQRYAPLFIDDAQSALDEIPAELSVSDVEYSVEGSGSTRSVSIGKITVGGKIEESGSSMSFSATYEDGCITAEADGETFDSCVIQADGDDLGEILGELDLDGLDEFRAEFEDILSDYDQPGITVKEVDGQWYVSPIATWFDQFFALTHAIDREEIDRAGEALQDMFGQVEGAYSDGLDDIYGTIEEGPVATIDVTETFPDDTLPDETVPEETDTEETFPEDTSPEAQAEDLANQRYQECTSLATVDEVVACMETAIGAGEMPDYYMPIELRYPECGVAEVTLGIVSEYDMTDEEYTVMLTTANTCFTALIEQGVIEDYEVSAEYLRPECAEGRNPMSFEAADQAEFFEKWLDCIYAE